MTEQSVPCPGLVWALITAVTPRVPAGSHFPFSHREELKKRRGANLRPQDRVKPVDECPAQSFIYFGAGLEVPVQRKPGVSREER